MRDVALFGAALPDIRRSHPPGRRAGRRRSVSALARSTRSDPASVCRQIERVHEFGNTISRAEPASIVSTASARVLGRIGHSLAIMCFSKNCCFSEEAALGEISTKRSMASSTVDIPTTASNSDVQPLGFAAKRVHDPERLQFKRQQILCRRNRNHKPCRRTIARKSPKLKMVGGTARASGLR